MSQLSLSRWSPWVGAGVAALVALVVWVNAAGSPKRTPMQQELQRYADGLQRALKYGDPSALDSLYDPLRFVLVRLEQAIQPGPELHFCRLAAIHLVEGIQAVQAGAQVWTKQPQFDAALRECR